MDTSSLALISALQKNPEMTEAEFAQHGMQAILNVIRSGIGKLDVSFEQSPDKKLWWKETKLLLDTIRAGFQGFGVSQAYILYVIQKHWEGVPKEVRVRYGTFDNFACSLTGRKLKTINEDLSVVETYLIDNHGPLHTTVSVPKRDQFGQLIKENNIIQTDARPWDPMAVSLSKLKAAKSAVRRGQVDDTVWSILMDPGQSSTDIQTYLYGSSGSGGDGDGGGREEKISFEVIGTLLVAHVGVEQLEIAELQLHQFDEETREVAEVALKEMLSRLKAFDSDEGFVDLYLQALAEEQVSDFQ